MLVEHAPARARASVPKWLWIPALVIIGLVGAAAIVLAVKFPFTRESIAKAIEESSAQKVRIGQFVRSYFPPACIAGNVTLLYEGRTLATIERLEIRGSYAGMISSPKRIPEVRIVGMRMQIPGKRSGSGKLTIPLTSGKGGKSVVISKIVADGAILEFEPEKSGGKPFEIRVHRLGITDVGSSQPMSYRTTLRLSELPGVVQSEGKFGPWEAGDPLQTPLQGTFTYNEVDLSPLKGISGHMNSKGEFHGSLGRIETKGETAVADFHVRGSSHNSRVATTFHAFVNGGNGATLLDPAIAHFSHTELRAEGPAADNGANLLLAIDHGRIEDVLRMFISDPKPPMSGALSLRAKFRWPPGEAEFLKKIRMEIDFGIVRGRFSSADTQGSLDRLSASVTDDPSTALSDLRGHASVRNGLASFRDVSFSVPGASATLSGTYGLTNQMVNLHGLLRTRGKLSETTTSWVKSLLLKAITPFFKKQHDFKIVPFKIIGPASTASVSLDLGSRRH